MHELGSIIKAAREHREITLRKAEELSGISNSYLNQIENGKIQKPSPETLNKLSLLYQIPYDILLEKAGYPRSNSDIDGVGGSAAVVTVLIVDDNSRDRELIRSYLNDDTPARYDVTEVETGEEALRVLSSQVPDCVLLDYRLPDMDGLAVFEKMKAMNALRDVSVVLLTGHGSEETAVRAMRMGAVNYLNKDSMTREKLGFIIGHAIKRKQLRMSLRQRIRQTPEDESFRGSVCAIAADLAAAAGRFAENNEKLRNDPDMAAMLGKLRELVLLCEGERGAAAGENDSRGEGNEYHK